MDTLSEIQEKEINYYQQLKAILVRVDSCLETLKPKEKRRLLNLIRKDFPVSKDNIKFTDENPSNRGLWGKRLEHGRKVIKLYEKAGAVEEDWSYHWRLHRSKQLSLHHRTDHMVKPERKDNKDYINRGSGGSNRNKIRYPKKVRKTAWKRFYKLFPHLKPGVETQIVK